MPLLANVGELIPVPETVKRCRDPNDDAFLDQDSQVCGGEPVIKGTRVTLRTLLASLGEGSKMEEILADYPSITADDLRAVIAFAAVSAGEDLPIPPLPKVA